MENRVKVLAKLKALRNFALDSDDFETQALGNILNTVYLAEKNGDIIDLMKVMAGFMIEKTNIKNKEDGRDFTQNS